MTIETTMPPLVIHTDGACLGNPVAHGARTHDSDFLNIHDASSWLVTKRMTTRSLFTPLQEMMKGGAMPCHARRAQKVFVARRFREKPHAAVADLPKLMPVFLQTHAPNPASRRA